MLHTCIRVKNLEKSLRFYEDALGLIETRRKISQNISLHLFIYQMNLEDMRLNLLTIMMSRSLMS